MCVRVLHPLCDCADAENGKRRQGGGVDHSLLTVAHMCIPFPSLVCLFFPLLFLSLHSFSPSLPLSSLSLCCTLLIPFPILSVSKGDLISSSLPFSLFSLPPVLSSLRSLSPSPSLLRFPSFSHKQKRRECESIAFLARLTSLFFSFSFPLHPPSLTGSSSLVPRHLLSTASAPSSSLSSPYPHSALAAHMCVLLPPSHVCPLFSLPHHPALFPHSGPLTQTN